MSRGYARWRRQALLGVALALGVVVLANRVARRRLELRADLSQDALFSTSEVAARLLGSLQDVLQVRAYFTGEVELGPVQIAKRRLVDQLQELQGAAGGRMEVLYADPNSSSEARAEAEALGVQPVPLKALQGTTEVTQDVYLGLVLRYRGREAVVPFCLPQVLEYSFLSELFHLLQEHEPAVGFVVGDGRRVEGDAYTEARALLEGYRVVEVLDLDRGVRVPEDLSLLVVVRPSHLHPRAAFEIDQHLQRGGRVLLLLDAYEVDPTAGKSEALTTGLEGLLAARGVRPLDGLACDQERFNPISTRPADGEAGRTVRLPYPFWLAVPPDGMERSLPVTGRLPGADLFWAVPLELEGAAEDGVERDVLVRSSPTTFVVDPAEALDLDPRVLAARASARLATGRPGSLALAVSVTGRAPSAFPDGAPAAFDPYREAVGGADEGVDASVPVSSGETPGRLVVIGDADWAHDGPFFTDRNKMLFRNLVDWLALAGDLVDLRAHLPEDRRIEDFLAAERKARSLLGVSAADDPELALETSRLEAEARSAAATRRRLRMAAATGGSLAAALVLGLALRRLLSAGRLPTRKGAPA